MCVNTHCQSDPSRSKRPPRSAFPTNFGGSQRRPLEIAPTSQVSGQQTLQHELSTHFNALSSATIGTFEVLVPQFQSCFISLQSVVFAFWIIEIFFPCPWPPSFSRRLSLGGLRLGISQSKSKIRFFAINGTSIAIPYGSRQHVALT